MLGRATRAFDLGSCSQVMSVLRRIDPLREDPGALGYVP